MIKKFWITLFLLVSICISGCSFSRKFYLDDVFYWQDKYIEITAQEFEKLENENYVLFTYNNYCALSIPCDEIFQEFMTENNISFLSMKYDEFKNTKLHDEVRFAPSVIVVKNWKVIDYLDSEEDDVNLYQDVNEFAKWIWKYVLIK